MKIQLESKLKSHGQLSNSSPDTQMDEPQNNSPSPVNLGTKNKELKLFSMSKNDKVLDEKYHNLIGHVFLKCRNIGKM